MGDRPDRCRPETARTLVSTAKRLQEFPEVDPAVSTGVIGFDRAVAVSRFAGRDDSLDILNETAGFDIAADPTPRSVPTQ